LDLGAYIIHLVSFLFFGMREFHPTLLLDQYVAWVFWSTSIVSLPFGLAFGFVYARWVRPMILRRWLWLAKAQRPPMST
jgi:hypothetical protein